MPELPTGIVTFLKTDIEGSSAMRNYPEVFVLHDQIVHDTVRRFGGTKFYDGGDGYGFVFEQSVVSALQTAVAIQEHLREQSWGEASEVRVRMAVHVGEAKLRAEGDGYSYLPALLVLARLMEVACGGQILLTAEAAGLAQQGNMPPELSLHHLGEHLLRDLERRPLFQLDYPGVSTFPALRTLDNLPNNLPPQDTSFIGREEEIQDVHTVLEEKRLLTLTGTGGCGKTRLALQAAALLLDRFPDGVWFIELAPLPRDAPVEIVAKTVAGITGLHSDSSSETVQRLSDHLQNRRLLLLFDNCEHLTQSCREITRKLLERCPNLRILATSRSLLGSPGEERRRVREMATLETGLITSLEECLSRDAIRLFVERARQADPEFEFSLLSAPYVVGICRKLSGLPLAIELVAARLYSFGLLELQDAMEELPPPEDLVGSGRFRTMQSALQWSYDLLPSETERRVFRHLAAFQGGWFLEAARTVCSNTGISENEVLASLEALNRASLVTAENRDVRKRYRMLEPVREFALKRLQDAGEEEAVRDRHFSYFSELARDAEPHLTDREQQNWVTRLEADHDNLRAALAWTPRSKARLEMAARLWRFWHIRGYLSEGRARLQNAIGLCREDDMALRAKALNGLGVLATWQGDFAEAKQHLDQSLQYRETLQDTEGCAEVHLTQGNWYLMQEDFALAKSCYEASLHLRRQTGNRWGLASALLSLGIVARHQKQHQEAQAAFQESHDIFQSLGDETNQAAALVNLGVICLDQNRLSQARNFYMDALKIYEQCNNSVGIARCYQNSAEVLFRENRPQEALDYYCNSLLKWYTIGNSSSIFLCLAQMAEVWGMYEEWGKVASFIAFLMQQGATLPRDKAVKLEALRVKAHSALGEAAYAAHTQERRLQTLKEAIDEAIR